MTILGYLQMVTIFHRFLHLTSVQGFDQTTIQPVDFINVHCLSDGPTNIVCPAGTGMVISSAGIYAALTGTCPPSGSTTCTVDLANTFASIRALCNAQQTCNYNAVIPATLPPECVAFTGIPFIQTLYRCYAVHEATGATGAAGNLEIAGATDNQTNIVNDILNHLSPSPAVNVSMIGSIVGTFLVVLAISIVTYVTCYRRRNRYRKDKEEVDRVVISVVARVNLGNDEQKINAVIVPATTAGQERNGQKGKPAVKHAFKKRHQERPLPPPASLPLPLPIKVPGGKAHERKGAPASRITLDQPSSVRQPTLSNHQSPNENGSEQYDYVVTNAEANRIPSSSPLPHNSLQNADNLYTELVDSPRTNSYTHLVTSPIPERPRLPIPLRATSVDSDADNPYLTPY